MKTILRFAGTALFVVTAPIWILPAGILIVLAVIFDGLHKVIWSDNK